MLKLVEASKFVDRRLLGSHAHFVIYFNFPLEFFDKTFYRKNIFNKKLRLLRFL